MARQRTHSRGGRSPALWSACPFGPHRLTGKGLRRAQPDVWMKVARGQEFSRTQRVPTIVTRRVVGAELEGGAG